MNRRSPAPTDRPSDALRDGDPTTSSGPFASSSAAPRNRRRDGFALLITITLLAFLVLLLVSLASLTRVETQVAANSQQLAQARQNALMALNIALGQLQKYEGPDQRTTARADLENGAGKNNGQWIGAYGSSVKADYADDPVTIATNLTAASNITTTGSPARLLNWLVSGNEGTAFDPAWGAGSVGTSGQITASPSPVFKPAGAVTGLTATTQATDTTLKITNAAGVAKPARLLVGSNSVTSSVDASGNPIDYVVAPAVDIQTQVPGLAGTPTIGRYAWWVGDEGMKARVNLPLAGTDPTLSAADRQEQVRNAFSNSTRDAVELMAKDTPGWAATMPALTASRIDTLYNPAQTALAPIVSPGQVPLASTNPSAMSPALKYRFHDVTTESVSVLSDTYAGGLKRDLSILLDSSYNTLADSDATTANSTRMWVPDAADSGAFPSGTISGFAIPTWKHLRSYYQTRVPATAQPSMAVRLPAHDKSGEPDHVGIAPIITYFSMGWRMAPAGPRAEGTQINMNLYPLVVLWNPYDFAIKATPRSDGSHYEVGIFPTYNVYVSLEAETSTSPSTWTRRGLFNFQVDTSPVAKHVSKNKFIRFRLRLKNGEILPGQSLIFSLAPSESGKDYTEANILDNIEPEESSYVSVPFRSVNSATVAATIQPGEADLRYRVTEYIRTTPSYNFSSSFKNKGGGGVNIYVGEPDDISHVLAADYVLDNRPGSARQLLNPSTSGPAPFPNRRWYGTHQDIGWDNCAVPTETQSDGITSLSMFQAPEQLTYDPLGSLPTYVFLAQALFSGAGWNAQLNLNQFMFSTRWIAQGNMRAVRSGRTRRDENYNPIYTASAGSPDLQTPWQKFQIENTSESNRTSAGKGHDWINHKPVDATLFEFPYQGQTLCSIGQLQHANLSFVGAYPSYPIGNSLADYRLRSSTGKDFSTLPPGYQLVRTDKGTGNLPGDLAYDMRGYYDISYLLNRTLWDRYYFSTVPATGTVAATTPLANPRHVRYDTTVDLQNPDKSAAGLVLAGGFNINSTSEQAWRAVLAGVNQIPYDPEHPDSATTTSLRTAFTRFSRPAAGDDPTDAWEGYRTLTGDQVAQLARNIVTEIRNRGPFVSLADFVNRRLVDNTATADNTESYRGAIQSAIDRTATASSSTFPVNDPSPGSFWAGDELAVGNGTSFVNQGTQYTDGYWEQGRLEGRMAASTPTVKSAGNRSAFAPKYVTQADILATIGSSLTARSDTFSVRTYGEVVNPATGEITGRAWCEAVVQRLPAYVENSVTPWAAPANGSASQTFGRKFKIISFRWLSPTDI